MELAKRHFTLQGETVGRAKMRDVGRRTMGSLCPHGLNHPLCGSLQVLPRSLGHVPANAVAGDECYGADLHRRPPEDRHTGLEVSGGETGCPGRIGESALVSRRGRAA